MDPKQVLLDCEQALQDGDIEAAEGCILEYQIWRHKGGFEPEQGDAIAAGLAERLDAAINAEVDRLAVEYQDEIADWNWKGLQADCASNAEPGEDGDLVGRTFLGTVFAIMPSGKYYMPWTSNQTHFDEARGSAFMEALETAASDAGGWIENGEGDPCDLFFAMVIEQEGD